MLVTLLPFLALLNGYSGPYHNLGINDLILEMEAQREAALSSGYVPRLEWQSFNEWRCFASLQVLPAIHRIHYGNKEMKTSVLQVVDFPKNHEFTLSPNEIHRFQKTHNRWLHLLSNSRYVCIFAANLPSRHHTGKDELWYLDRIKTDNGEWVNYDFNTDT